MAMSATSSYAYDYYPELNFILIWHGTEDRSKQLEDRMDNLFTCPTCERTKTGALYCSNSFHL